MPVPRASVVRGAVRFARGSRPTARAQSLRLGGRRGYSSGHGEAKASSDIPWAIGAIAVTVPSCAWLLQNSPAGHGDHDEHAESHGEAHEAKEPAEDEDTEAEANSEGEEAKKPAETEEKDSDDESNASDTPDTSDDEESNGSDDTKSENGATKKSSTGDKGDKKGSKQGTPEDVPEGKKSDEKDKPAASKKPQGKNEQSGKQEGLSNADTKHSTDLKNNPDKSSKGEGTPETSKTKGSVDPARPQK